MTQLGQFLEQFFQLSAVLSLVNIVIYFALAWLAHRLSWRIAGLILRLNDLTVPARLPPQLSRLAHATTMSKTLSGVGDWFPGEFRTPQQIRAQRQKTLRELVASAVSLSAFIIAAIASLHVFANADTIVWILGLLGTALAFAGRTFIGDLLAGLAIIFEDKFAVGEKILVKAQFEKFEGIIEHVNLNATWLRATTGELYVIQNGEMRFICNYSRGLHSSANITVKIPSADLDRALPLLRDLADEAIKLLPSLKEPWQVISETGAIGQHTELTLVVKTHFGQAAELRPQLLRLVQKRLAMADIPLAG
jgi:small-conductance mechanosensitive channel